MKCDQCATNEATFRAYMYRGEAYDYEVEMVCKDCALSITDEHDGSWVTLPTRSNVLSFEDIEADKPVYLTGEYADRMTPHERQKTIDSLRIRSAGCPCTNPLMCGACSGDSAWIRDYLAHTKTTAADTDV